MNYKYLHYNKKLINNAKILRKNMTKQEKHLWYDFLQKYPIKIYKQKVILNYILDFYCDKIKLAIEIDGSQHYSEEGIQHDIERTENLNTLGIKVLRFSNRDIDTNFNGVCTTIHNEIQNLIKENR